ncbi:hypothetical protein ABW19_dt0200521 [Dactylella cylindrospora]|nr:hypothetical protein ABW19_dt0200521 [Dactylella cylindrospora]
MATSTYSARAHDSKVCSLHTSDPDKESLNPNSPSVIRIHVWHMSHSPFKVGSSGSGSKFITGFAIWSAGKYRGIVLGVSPLHPVFLKLSSSLWRGMECLVGEIRCSTRHSLVF